MTTSYQRLVGHTAETADQQRGCHLSQVDSASPTKAIPKSSRELERCDPRRRLHQRQHWEGAGLLQRARGGGAGLESLLDIERMNKKVSDFVFFK
jgi:hypothetical protein